MKRRVFGCSCRDVLRIGATILRIGSNKLRIGSNNLRIGATVRINGEHGERIPFRQRYRARPSMKFFIHSARKFATSSSVTSSGCRSKVTKPEALYRDDW